GGRSANDRGARWARRSRRSGRDAETGAELELFLSGERTIGDAEDRAAVAAVHERGLVVDEAAPAAHAGAGALRQEAARRALEHVLGREQHHLRALDEPGACFGHGGRIVQYAPCPTFLEPSGKR